MDQWKVIAVQISEATQHDFSFTRATPLSGGDSNQAWLLEGTLHTDNKPVKARYFIKRNAAEKAFMFAAERAGLSAIAESRTVRVPSSVACGISEQYSFLVLEYLDLDSQGNGKLLGSQLAAMHRNHAEQFGWDQNNTIGVTPQHNNLSADWISFWGEQRLGFQLELAAHNGYGGRLHELGQSVVAALADMLANHRPAPSLLHGDLWGGNHGFLKNGTPVIFDPAPYYGDRETDIAMTELFGGFDKDFYAAYQENYPLDAGYAKRKSLYNLYHILNHCNMVSGGYVSQAETMMQKLLGENR